MEIKPKTIAGETARGKRAQKAGTAGLKKNGTRTPADPPHTTAKKNRGTPHEHQADLQTLLVENARLRESLARETQELTLLDRVRATIASKLDMPSLLRSVVESIVEVYGYTHASVYILEGETLILQHQVGYRDVIEHIGIHEGISGRVARTGLPMLVEDVAGNPEFLGTVDNIASEITVPLLDDGRVAGTLSVESIHKLTEEDLRVLVALGAEAGMAVGRARLYEDVQRRNRTLSALQESALAIMGHLGLSEALQAILAQAAQLINTEHGYIYLVRADGALQLMTGVGVYPKFVGIILESGEGLAGKVWGTAQPLIANDYLNWEGRSLKFEGSPFHAVVGIPLLRNAQVIGVLGLAHLTPGKAFHQADVELLSRFAQLASIAIENAGLYTRVYEELVERKQAEEALRDSQSQLESVFNSTMDGIITIDENQRIVFFNPAAEVIFRCPASKALGQSMDQFIPEGTREKHLGLIRNFGKSGETQRSMRGSALTLICLRADGETFPSDISISQIEVGGQKLFTAFVRDITERQQADERLRANEEQLAAVMEGSQLGYSDWNIQTGEIQRNERWAAMLGYKPEEIGASFSQWDELLYPEDRERAKKAVQDHLDGKTSTHRDEYRLRAKDGSYRWILDLGRVIEYDGQGRPLRMTATHTDVTERKKAEQALRESEEKYRNLVEHAPAVVYLDNADEAGTNFYISPQIENLIGYPSSAFIENPTIWHQLIFPGDYERTVNTIRETLKNDHAIEDYRMIAKDGRTLWIRDTSVLIRDENGHPQYIQGFLEDITTHKQAAEALRKSEQRLQAFFNQSLDGFFFCDFEEPIEWKHASNRDETLEYIFTTKRFTDVNDAMLKQYGVDREAFLNFTTRDIFVHDPEQGRKLRRELFDAGHLHLETFERTSNRTPVWFEGDYVCLYDPQERITGFFGIQREITDRKMAEQALRDSEQRYRALFDDVPIAIWEQDFSELKKHLDSLKAGGVTDLRVYFSERPEELLYCESMMRVLDLNRAALKMYEAGDKRELMRVTMEDASRGELENGVEEMAAIAEGRKSHFWEGSDETLTGRPIEIRMNWSVAPGHEGDYSRVIVTTTDITERKQAEEALLTSEKTFRGLFNSVAEAIYIQDAEGRFLDVNEGVLKIYGYPKEFFIGKTPESLSAPGRNDLNEIARAVEATFKGKPQQFEFWGLRSNGDVFPKDVRLYKGTYFGKDVVIALAQDITQRKEAEDTVRAAEEKYRSIFENAVEGIYQSTPEGRFHTVNPAFAEMLGYDSPQELIDSITDIANQLYHDRGRRRDFMSQLEAQESVTGFEYQMLRKDGKPVWVSENARLVRNAAGGVHYYEGILEDITPRKHNEQLIDNQLQRLNALHAIDSAINSNFDLKTTLDVLLREVIAQLQADATSVLLFNKDTHTLDYTAGRGFISKATQHTKLSAGEGYAGRIILDRKTIHIPDLTNTDNKLTEALSLAGENFAAYVGCPLIAKGQVVGVLEIFRRAPLAPDLDWFDFLSMIADQAAIAIDNAQLFENLQRSNFDLTLAYDATIEGWSHALDLRDRETEGHTQRVTNLTIKLARQIGIPDTDILHIRRGALLHDIGKMGIPDSILHKPDNLTPEEWDIMHQHTQYAYQMLSPIKYLKPALDIPRCHHEKWDGTGYPDGLMGEQIPIAARIFAVVDVWDALTSDRSYRDAWSREKVIEYIRAESGRHFDPTVVETFLSFILNE